MMSTLALAMQVSFVLELFRGELILPEQSIRNTNSPQEANDDITALGNSGYRLSITTGSASRDANTQWTDRHGSEFKHTRISA